jgi:hypothetical protein
VGAFFSVLGIMQVASGISGSLWMDSGQKLQHKKVDASLAQRLERSAVNRKVAGSIPAGGVFCSACPPLNQGRYPY